MRQAAGPTPGRHRTGSAVRSRTDRRPQVTPDASQPALRTDVATGARRTFLIPTGRAASRPDPRAGPVAPVDPGSPEENPRARTFSAASVQKGAVTRSERSRWRSPEGSLAARLL